MPTQVMSTQVTSRQVKIMAILAARPGKAGALRALLDGMLAPSRAEAGNLRYDLWQDQTDPARLVLDELYADAEAVAAHRATPHFQKYLSVITTSRSGPRWLSIQRRSPEARQPVQAQWVGKRR